MLGKIYAALLLIIMATTLPAGEPGPVPVEVLPGQIDLAYDEILKPQARGWLGGDGASSVKLSDSKTLWIFGDSPLGTISAEGKRTGPMIRNCIAIQDTGTGKVEFFWDLTDRLTGDFFHSDNFTGTHWYWPGTGAMVDGELFLFLVKVTKGADGGMFQTIGMTLFQVSNPLDSPDEWIMTNRELTPANDHRAFASGAYVEKPYIYLLGHDDGPTQSGVDRKMMLARVKLTDLKAGKNEESFEYWSDGNKWTNDDETLLPIFDKGSTESSLHYDSKRKLYMSVVLQPYTDSIYLYSSPNLTGPWSNPRKIYTIPELATDENYLAYAGKAHPQLSANPDELLITYVVNTSDFWSMFSDLDIYYPRFVRVDLTEVK